MRSAFVRALVAEAAKDERILLLTGDLGFMALEPFRDRFPDRFINMGAAEQNMVGVATGLAEAGYVPFCYSIVPFAVLRPFEFIRNGPVLHELPVRIVGMGGGFDYGTAGPTHYGVEDVGAMRLLRGMAIVAPADGHQTESAVARLSQWSGPAYLRLSKNDQLVVPALAGRFEFGRAHEVRDGSDLVVFAMGGQTQTVLLAADQLASRGISARVVALTSISPPPVDDIIAFASRHPIVVTVEDHVLDGGIGSLVAEVIADHGLSCRLLRIGIDQPFSGRGGSERYLLEAHGLSSNSVAMRIHSLFDTSNV